MTSQQAGERAHTALKTSRGTPGNKPDLLFLFSNSVSVSAPQGETPITGPSGFADLCDGVFLTPEYEVLFGTITYIQRSLSKPSLDLQADAALGCHLGCRFSHLGSNFATSQRKITHLNSLDTPTVCGTKTNESFIVEEELSRNSYCSTERQCRFRDCF